MSSMYALGARVATILDGAQKPAPWRSGLVLCALEHFVVAVRVEGRVDGDAVVAVVGEFFELFEAVAAVDDAGVQER
jgi:hypothetical protein